MSNEIQTTNNPFAVATSGGGALAQRSVTSDMVTSRAAQEVQAAMVVAKKFPRDEVQAFNLVMKACSRPTLAEVAMYAYPRGGQTVTGPSIRLAEELARSWGNIDFGIIELEQDIEDGSSKVMAYAWDLQTNTRQTKVFEVRHERKAQGVIKRLDDPRDIYEMVANQGARRVRACILGIIPGDVVEAALDQCEKTMKGKSTEPLSDRIRKMVAAFAEMGVTQKMLETRLNHNMDATNETELVGLRKIYMSLKDGHSDREEFFKPEAGVVEKPTAPAKTVAPAKSAATTAPAKTPAPAKQPEPPKEPAEPKQPEPPSDPEPKGEAAEPAATTTAPVKTAAPAKKAAPAKAAATSGIADMPLEGVVTAIKEKIEALGVPEDKFVEWLNKTGYVSSPLENLNQLAEFSPKKTRYLLEHWADYEPTLVEFSQAQ